MTPIDATVSLKLFLPDVTVTTRLTGKNWLSGRDFVIIMEMDTPGTE